MVSLPQHDPAEPAEFQRIIGEYSTGQRGPMLVFICGLHGNEQAGVFAAKTILNRLRQESIPFQGKLLCLCGNVSALQQKQRFMTRDLNRRWSNHRIRRLLKQPAEKDTPEDAEQRELVAIFDELMNRAREPIMFVDFHSTSAFGYPFCGMSDTLRNRKLAYAMKVPVVIGLDETIEGALMGYLSDFGHIGVFFEGGQHDAPETMNIIESAMWLTLVASGAVQKEAVNDYEKHDDYLSTLCKGLPQIVEIRHRHALKETDQFVMKPGFTNFAPIVKGQLLASDQNGPIYASENSMMLMPLYQPQGEDGYFLVRKVARFWLALSRLLRNPVTDKFLPLFPGIVQSRVMPQYLLVKRRVACFLTAQIFHLFGYRRRRQIGSIDIYTRRRPGFRPFDTEIRYPDDDPSFG